MHGTASCYRKGCREDACRKAATAKRYASPKGKAVREFLEAAKARPCMDCGGTFPRECMDFDHRPDESKSFMLGRGPQTRSLASVQTEVAKCDLVCSNCHRTRTRQRREMM